MTRREGARSICPGIDVETHLYYNSLIVQVAPSGGEMQKAEPEAAPGPRANGVKTPVNRERKAAAEATDARKESTRSWASRRAEGPSWVEKIEQF
jgi:hypothetical protein